VGWHQDAGSWPLSPSKAVTVWLAIDDAEGENACMRFIPGTHTCGHLTYALTEDSDPSLLNQVVPEVEKFGKTVVIVTHDPSAAKATSHIRYLEKGTLLPESEKPEEY
jgi:hypothetical protein